eukprot:TRINITY_DN3086_c0_g1_i22.p1 TRINITY_DN3086_c0_g1~~TRINITY_DN3086_c0_g1_i22.p1  ORF type:complete len:467 (+),score=111.01 TRINITY_DN3086_c0_g1_i22:191-1402(+)
MDEEDDKEPEDLKSSKVVTKYRSAGDICNEALAFVVKEIAVGKKIVDICAAGDNFINQKTSKIYNKGKIEKGVAFPTAISVNNVVGHFSPAADHKAVFADGDLVKVDLGVHIDGYVAVGAHSFILGNPVADKRSDVLAAAYTAAEYALKLLKPGVKSTQITEAVGKVAADFKCLPVQGVLSHEMKRFVIDGEKVILNRADIDQKVEEFEFAPNEVYAIDIVISTGLGKPQEVDERPTIFKRAPDSTYNLKRKASRQVFGEILKKHAVFPFNIRSLDPKVVNFAIKECATHELVHPYPVLYEKTGDYVAHIKFTALLLPSGTVKITGLAFDKSKLKTTVTVKNDDLLKTIATATSTAKTAGKKKKKKKAKKPKKAKTESGAVSKDGGKDDDEDEEEEGEAMETD